MGPWAKHLRARLVYTRIDRINQRAASPFPAAIDPNNPRCPSTIPSDLYCRLSIVFTALFFTVPYTGLRRDRASGIYDVGIPCSSTNGVTRVSYTIVIIHRYTRA